MADLLSLIRYLYDKYPNKSELSWSRLIAMIYLADWRHSIKHGSQMTNLQWKISNGEPQLNNYYFEQLLHSLVRSQRKMIPFLRRVKLHETEKDVLDFVINSSKTKTEKELAQLVHSTYPVVTQNQSNYIDLVDLAEKYEEVKPLLTK